MAEIEIPESGLAVGKKIVDLHFPKSALIAMIKRNDQFIIPRGATEIEAADTLIVVSDNQAGIDEAYERLDVKKQT